MTEVSYTEQKYFTGFFPTPADINEELILRKIDIHTAANYVHVPITLFIKYLKGQLRMPAGLWELLYIKASLNSIGDRLYNGIGNLEVDEADAILRDCPSSLYRDAIRNYIKCIDALDEIV